MADLRSIPRYLGLALLFATAADGEAIAQNFPAPEVSVVSGGSYTVTYHPNCYNLPAEYICGFSYLQEKIGETGAWTNISSDTGSISFQDKPDGRYFYRVYLGAYSAPTGFVEAYSAEASVLVAATAVRESVVAQMSYRYEVRQGDINGDGRKDLYLRKQSGGTPYDGTIEQLVVQQAADGQSFIPVVPNSAEASTAAYWPLSPAEAIVSDVNVDGYVDVTLSRVASAVGGASDQIVFAPGQPGVAEPLGIRAYDAELGQFVGNVMDYYADQQYFTDNAPVRYIEFWYWYGYCFPWAYSTLDYYAYWGFLGGCYVDYFRVTGVYQDFSVFSEEALTFWANDYDAFNGNIDEEQGLAEVEQAVEGLLGTGIGGWPMEEILGPQGEHRDPFVRRAIEIGQSVLGQARGGRNATTSVLVPPQEVRLPDQIYLTGHPLAFARSRGHLALEYVDSLGGGIPYTGTTISGEPEHNNFFDFGKLFGRDDRPTDHPLFNFYIGDVDPLHVSNHDYWTGYLRPRHANYQALPYNELMDYALVPSAAAGTHNSNSYARGVTQDSPGNVEIRVPFGIGARYPGWNEPVPDVKFR